MSKLRTSLSTAASLILMATNGAHASGKLLLTSGVNSVEGASGGGLTPWATIGSYATEDEIGANTFYTQASSQRFSLTTFGVVVGLHDRVELSYAKQSLDTGAAGSTLGLGRGFTFDQDIYGVKVKLIGDAVLDQDSALPQISLGLLHKRNTDIATVLAVGAHSARGTDLYLAATKLWLEHSVLTNLTLRASKSNQLGLLGFGDETSNHYRPQLEASAAYLLRRDLAIGAEFRMKPNNLRFAREDDWADVFVAYTPNKYFSLTFAYVGLGDVATVKNQNAWYLSANAGF
jgi:Protein of unknown function (DUF3034)